MRKKIIGIYKITSPTKRVYIGQSDDIFRRFSSYKNLQCKTQPKLYNSFRKHGVDKHVFEIVCECDIENLDSYERYYQELYNCISSKHGLNCVLKETGKLRRVYNEEYSLKMSKIFKGREFSKETRKKMSESKKGVIGVNHNNHKKVRCYNIKTKETIIMATYETARFFGVDWELINKRCLFNFVSPTKLKDWDFEYLDNPVKKELNLGQNKLLIDLETGVYYYGKTDLANCLNTSLGMLNYIGIFDKGRYKLC